MIPVGAGVVGSIRIVTGVLIVRLPLGGVLDTARHLRVVVGVQSVCKMSKQIAMPQDSIENDAPAAPEGAYAFRSDSSHLALINEVSALVMTEPSSERVFAAVAELIYQSFGCQTVTFYAGDPLTLRLQFGGVPTPLGTRVPEGLAHRALAEQAPITYADFDTDGAVSRPPWTPEAVRSEAAFPLLFRGQQVGVLDLFCTRQAPLEPSAINTLSVLARLLVISAMQERWSGEDRASRKLHRAYERLQDFAEFKDQILQNISHELRTPLTLVKGYLELIHVGQMGEVSPEQDQTLRIVLRKVDEIVTIINRMVALSPFGSLSLEYERMPVAELLDEALALFSARAAASGVALLPSKVEPDLCLYGDREQIRQVCYNILDNSVKFSPHGGQVSIDARAEEDYVHLVFRDEGIGIEKQQLTQIFDTFYQVDGSTTRRFGGLGLGLAVVNRVVRAHKGKVWAESEVNRGSAFHVLLPKYSAQPHPFGTR